MEIQKRCNYYGRSFIAHKMNTIYCSPSCNNKDYKKAIRNKQIAEFIEEEKKKTPKVDILGGKEVLTPTPYKTFSNASPGLRTGAGISRKETLPGSSI